MKRLKGSYLLLIVILLAVFSSCVPLKRQLVFSDNTKYTLNGKQRLDTVIKTLPYEYKIRRGDVLSVKIVSVVNTAYKIDNVIQNGGDVGNGYVVNDTGYVDIPILGLVKLEGKPIDEARRIIKEIASEYLNNVSVSVNLVSFKITVFGEKGGTVTSPDGKITIVEAVAQFGGPSEFTNLKRIKVIRRLEGGDKLHVFYIDISDVGIIATENYYLQPDDILVLEPLRLKNAKYYRLLLGYATTTISFAFLIYSVRNRVDRIL